LHNRGKQSKMTSDKKQVSPKAQAFSDALMALRGVAAELKVKAFEAQNAMFELQDDEMQNPNSKMFAMYGGDIELGLMELAGSQGKVKALHVSAQQIGNKLGIAMPESPTYDTEYLDLAGKKIPVMVSGKVLRR